MRASFSYTLVQLHMHAFPAVFAGARINSACWWPWYSLFLLRKGNSVFFMDELGCLNLPCSWLPSNVHSADHRLPLLVSKAEGDFGHLAVSVLSDGVSGDQFLWPNESTLSSTPGLCQGASTSSLTWMHSIENKDSIHWAKECSI